MKDSWYLRKMNIKCPVCLKKIVIGEVGNIIHHTSYRPFPGKTIYVHGNCHSLIHEKRSTALFGFLPPDNQYNNNKHHRANANFWRNGLNSILKVDDDLYLLGQCESWDEICSFIVKRYIFLLKNQIDGGYKLIHSENWFDEVLENLGEVEYLERLKNNRNRNRNSQSQRGQHETL